MACKYKQRKNNDFIKMWCDIGLKTPLSKIPLLGDILL